ncbi:MAG: GtrA family protein [Sciscionella sp.]
MAMIETMLARVQEPLRSFLIKHRELLKFTVVGGVAFVTTLVINYGLKYTVLWTKPITAMAVAVICATIVSYVLSREWSFRTRGGRERHHEAALFFLVNGVAMGINLAPQAISRYVLHLSYPYVSVVAQETSDFISAFIIGTVLGTAARFLGYKYLVFPRADSRPRTKIRGTVRPLRPSDAKHLPGDDQVA